MEDNVEMHLKQISKVKSAASNLLVFMWFGLGDICLPLPLSPHIHVGLLWNHEDEKPPHWSLLLKLLIQRHAVLLEKYCTWYFSGNNFIQIPVCKRFFHLCCHHLFVCHSYDNIMCIWEGSWALYPDLGMNTLYVLKCATVLDFSSEGRGFEMTGVVCGVGWFVFCLSPAVAFSEVD